MYTIIDIETTGGNNKSGRITEIAAFLHDGNKLLDVFSTLVNPGMPIPPFITNLTGISNEMVSTAPTFEEIANKLERFTANSIFVAHNVHFDYGFIREEFRRLGKDFNRRTLCTVQLSRKSFPGLPSYSLDKITKQLDISLEGHHRAETDARATVHLFEKIIAGQTASGLFSAHFGIPDTTEIKSPYINKAFLESIPDLCGVFRFYNSADELIYVKRSPQILSAICSKLQPGPTADSKDLLNELYRIDWEITGSALAAQLIEANEVLSHKPLYNHSKFSMKAQYAISLQGDGAEKMLVLNKHRQDAKADMVFANFFAGLDYLKDLSKKYGLEIGETASGRRKTPCLKLNGQGSGNLIAKLLPTDSYLVLDEAPTVSLRTAVLVREGLAQGMAFIDANEPFMDFTEDNLTYRFHNHPELEMVMRSFIAKNRYEKIIPFN